MSLLPAPNPGRCIAPASQLVAMPFLPELEADRLGARCMRAHLYPVGRANVHHRDHSPALAELEEMRGRVWQEHREELLTGLWNRATVPDTPPQPPG